MTAQIGILALQGGFDLHARCVEAIGAKPVLVKKKEQLAGLSGLILPGGESSVLLHLTDEPFREAIKVRVKEGLPLLATCAGLIFIADSVENPAQESLRLLNISVRRNAYGRQKESFIAKDLPEIREAVFIRAPQITRCGEGVEVLATYDEMPILVQQSNIVGATFHPELAQELSPVYQRAFPRIVCGQ